MNRRALLKLASAAIVATPAAAQCIADMESPLRALYYRWQGIKAEYSALPTDCDEETDACLYRQMVEVEHQAADYAPQSMEDLAFKIIFADDDGDMDMNIHQTALAARAYALVGIEPASRG